MTSAPAYKAALLAALQARAELGGVFVRWGRPPTLPDERERLYIWRDRAHERDVGRGGIRSETYFVDLDVEVLSLESDPQLVEGRMRAIEDEIEAVLPGTLPSGVVLQRVVFTPGDSEPLPTDQGYLAHCEPSIRVTALL